MDLGNSEAGNEDIVDVKGAALPDRKLASRPCPTMITRLKLLPCMTGLSALSSSEIMLDLCLGRPAVVL